MDGEIMKLDLCDLWAVLGGRVGFVMSWCLGALVVVMDSEEISVRSLCSLCLCGFCASRQVYFHLRYLLFHKTRGDL